MVIANGSPELQGYVCVPPCEQQFYLKQDEYLEETECD